jgi:opacity protein-like surface antigen
LPVLLSTCAVAQQSYVGRFDIYNGFAYFDSPDINLTERGYHLQLGYNPRTWLALGFDYSVVTGTLTLTPDLLKPSLQASIAAELAPLVHAGVIPSTYTLSIPVASTTHTFAAGPQYEFRHFSRVTLFVRPSIGAIYEDARPHATDPIAVGIAKALAPTGDKTDWRPFYGAGGGAEFNLTDHFALRFQADYVHNALFTDLLKASRNTLRLSVGPAFHIGKNIAGR